MQPNGVAERDLTVAKPGRAAYAALLLLLGLNLFNYIDRYILAAVVPEIRASVLAADDPNPNFKMGLLSTAFMVSYMALAPAFGWLGDRFRRWWIVGIGIILWSLASGGSGLAASYGVLFLTRCLVGVGEAAYGPVAPTIIADLFPIQVRGRKLAWFYAAIPVGSALGYAFGGHMAEAAGAEGWRRAFYFVVPPGICLGMLCLLMREPIRGEADAAPMRRTLSLSDYTHLLSIPSYVLNTLGMTAMTFAFGGLAYWMPTYLHDERGAPTLAGADTRLAFGALTALAGLSATLAGGWLGDRLRSRYSGSYFLVSGVSMLIGFPMVLLVLRTPFPLNWLAIFVTVFCLFVNTGPTNTILANVTNPGIRAGAFAFNILIIHILGDVISPSIIGYVSDRTGGLEGGFALVSLFILVGGVLWLWGARYLEADTRRAPLPIGAKELTSLLGAMRSEESAPAPR